MVVKIVVEALADLGKSTMGEALDQIPDGARMYVAGATAIPLELLQSMADEHDRYLKESYK